MRFFKTLVVMLLAAGCAVQTSPQADRRQPQPQPQPDPSQQPQPSANPPPNPSPAPAETSEACKKFPNLC